MGREILKDRKQGVKKAGLAITVAKALDDTLNLVKAQNDLKREIETRMR